MAWRCAVTLATAVALPVGLAATATAAPAFPFPAPPTSDPRLGQIRVGLEQRGLRVLDLNKNFTR